MEIYLLNPSAEALCPGVECEHLFPVAALVSLHPPGERLCYSCLGVRLFAMRVESLQNLRRGTTG